MKVAVSMTGAIRKIFAALPITVLLLAAACGTPNVKDGDAATQGSQTGDPSIYDPPVALPGPGTGDAATVAPDATTPGQPGATAQGTMVAILLPLSGEDAPIGKAMLDASQIAVFDIADDSFRLSPYDTKGTPDGARAAAEKAIADGARLLLGPLFSTSVALVAPVARAAGVNIIAFSNNRAVAGDGAYLIGFLPREQIDRIVSYAGTQGLRRFATLVPETDFGSQVVADLRDAAAKFGGEVTKVQTYPAGLRDLSEPVRLLGDYAARKRALGRQIRTLKGRRDAKSRRELKKLRTQDTYGDLSYDAILLPQNGSGLKAIAALLPFYDIDTAKIQLLGLASWHQPGLGSEPPLVGAWYPAPQLEAQLEFEKRFSDTYRYKPPLVATLAYDATALASVLARRAGRAEFTTEALTSANGFAGAAGIFRFLPSGESQRSLAIMEVRSSRVRVLNPARQVFSDLSN